MITSNSNKESTHIFSLKHRVASHPTKIYQFIFQAKSYNNFNKDPNKRYLGFFLFFFFCNLSLKQSQLNYIDVTLLRRR